MTEKKHAREMTVEEIEQEAKRRHSTGRAVCSGMEHNKAEMGSRMERTYLLDVIRELKAPPLVSVVIPAGRMCESYLDEPYPVRCPVAKKTEWTTVCMHLGEKMDSNYHRHKDCPMGAGAFVVEMRRVEG